MHPDLFYYLTDPMFFSTVISMVFLWGIMVFISSALLKWLWNITIPGIFGLRRIEFWEAFRLILIVVLLFGKGFNINF